jgi:hypothetical protein
MMRLQSLALSAFSLLWAIIIYMAACSTAQAATHAVRFQNPGAELAYTALETEWGTVPVSCAPGATCSVVLDIPFGSRVVSGRAMSGSLRSEPSNEITVLVLPTPAECLAIPACRHDADQNGTVTVSDFGSFLGTMGRSWVP